MLKGKLTFAYTAGIIDGDGCIGIYRQKNKTKRGFTHVLIVAVWNTKLWLVQAKMMILTTFIILLRLAGFRLGGKLGKS